MEHAVPLRPSKRVAITLDVAVVVATYLAALVWRFAGRVPSAYAARFAAFIPLIVATYLVVGLVNRVYPPDGTTLRVYAASLLSPCLLIVGVFLIDPTPRPIPLVVVVLGGFASLVGLVGWRLVASTRRLR